MPTRDMREFQTHTTRVTDDQTWTASLHTPTHAINHGAWRTEHTIRCARAPVAAHLNALHARELGDARLAPAVCEHVGRALEPVADSGMTTSELVQLTWRVTNTYPLLPLTASS